MLYKEDWEQAQERMRAWFAGEETDRPIVQVCAARAGNHPKSAWGFWDTLHHRDDPQRVIEEFEKYCQGTYFGGEAFPLLNIYLGAGSVAACLGCDVQIAPDTVWFEPKQSWSWERIVQARADETSEWWRTTLRLTEAVLEAGKGKFFTGLSDLGAPMNVLGSLRGTQDLLMDLHEDPKAVKRASGAITAEVMRCYDEQLAMTRRHGAVGSATWMGIWFPGRGSDVQCDFSAMISPKQFEEFIVPDLQEQCRRLDHSIYHWDGPGQIPHLDLLLEIPELDGIQWIPGAGQEPVGSPKWYPLYHRIQAKGKKLTLQYIPPEDVEPLLRELSPEGLLFTTGCWTEEEARDLVRMVERVTGEKRRGK